MPSLLNTILFEPKLNRVAYKTASKTGISLLLASTDTNALPEKAFRERLGVSNTHPSAT